MTLSENYRLVCHRGLHDIEKGVPENTLAAFDAACVRGHGIELDVHITADGKLVVYHDWNTQRLCGKSLEIRKSAFKQLKELKICKTEHTIPAFEEMLECVNGRVPLIIEMKNRNAIGPLESAVCNALEKYKGDFVLESFNPRVVRWLKLNAPQYVRGQLADRESGFFAGLYYRVLLTSGYASPQFIAYEINSLNEALVKKIRARGNSIVTWTVKTQEQLEKARVLGCDSIIYEKIRL